MNQSGFHRMSPDFRTINTLEVKPTIKRIVFWNCWCTYLPKQCRFFSLDVCIRGLDLHYGGAGIYRSGCPHGVLRRRFRRVGSFPKKNVGLVPKDFLNETFGDFSKFRPFLFRGKKPIIFWVDILFWNSSSVGNILDCMFPTIERTH